MSIDRMTALRGMLERNPKDTRALFGLAAEYEKREDWRQVITHLEQYLESTDDQGNAWGRLARAYLQVGRQAEAIEAYARGAAQARAHGHPSMAAEFDELRETIESTTSE